MNIIYKVLHESFLELERTKNKTSYFVVSYVELKLQILGSTITQNNYIKQNNKYYLQGSP